jgi:hypothetical protein
MSELAYMVREDWAQRGTAMRQQSAVVRDWLGHPPYVFATADRKKYESDNGADREFVTYVAHAASDRNPSRDCLSSSGRRATWCEPGSTASAP